MHHRGAVAAGHSVTAEVGAQTLAAGGNAIDAAVAAVFASCTCEPTLTGPGGAGFATVFVASERTTHVCDFFAAVPGRGLTVESPTGPVPVEVMFGTTAQTFHVGPQSCAVPGFVRGVLALHERWGRLPRAEVLQPGIDLARRGLELTDSQAYCHRLLRGIVTRTETGRELFAPGGDLLGVGELFVQPGFASMLEALARDGADSFYTGEIASEILKWSHDNEGLISRADLATYEARFTSPVTTRYRDLTFHAPAPPSSGGALVAYALRLLDMQRKGAIDVASEDGAVLLVRAMVAANSARGRAFDSKLYGTADGKALASWLLSEEMLQAGVASEEHDDTQHASSHLGSTTHLSVIDEDDNAVSMTTSTGCGSGEFVGDTGIHLNNMLGEEDLLPVEHALVPGDRLTSMMAPSLLLHDDRPLLATGSAGSNRLRSAILQTLVRVVESRYTAEAARSLQDRLAEATSAPRLHAEAGLVHIEPGFDQAVYEALEQAGNNLHRWEGQNLYFGGVNMVSSTEHGAYAAAADPRRGGGAWLALSDGSVRRL